MTRTILALTTAIGVAFAVPAMAQTVDDDVLDEVRSALESNGYVVEQAETLPTSDVAEIYFVATSGTAEDLRRALSAMDLVEMEVEIDMDPVPNTEELVADILVDHGYDPSSVDYLSDAKIAEIYVASSSGEATDVEDVLAPLNLPVDGEIAAEPMADPNDSIANEVQQYLSTAGYEQSQIDALTDEQRAEIYLLIVSGGDMPIETEVEAIVNS